MDTKSIFNIYDERVIIDEVVSTNDTNTIYATLINNNKCCEYCNSNEVILHGNVYHKVNLLNVNDKSTYMILKKKRFKCKCCNKTFVDNTSVVNKYSNYSNSMNEKINELLSYKISLSDISKLVNVSLGTVYNNFSNIRITSKDIKLPNHILFDEFKSTKDSKGAMSFIYMNAETGEMIDILENRQLKYLKSYFNKFSLEERKSVRSITIDMYTPYMSLITELFPNAKIILDRFHLYNLIERSLTKTRIKIMNTFNSDHIAYKFLKNYKNILILDYEQLSDKQKNVLDIMLSFSTELLETYNVYQLVRKCLKKKQNRKLLKLLKRYVCNDNISKYLQISLKSLLTNFQYVKNALCYKYSNGKLEGKNNLIKVIKRIAFGYRKFINFKKRVFIISNSTI